MGGQDATTVRAGTWIFGDRVRSTIFADHENACAQRSAGAIFKVLTCGTIHPSCGTCWRTTGKDRRLPLLDAA